MNQFSVDTLKRLHQDACEYLGLARDDMLIIRPDYFSCVYFPKNAPHSFHDEGKTLDELREKIIKRRDFMFNRIAELRAELARLEGNS